MKLGSSLPRSQESATCPSSETKSSTWRNTHYRLSETVYSICSQLPSILEVKWNKCLTDTSSVNQQLLFTCEVYITFFLQRLGKIWTKLCTTRYCGRIWMRILCSLFLYFPCALNSAQTSSHLANEKACHCVVSKVIVKKSGGGWNLYYCKVVLY